MIAARHLKYQAFEVFLPLITKTSRTTKKFTTKTVPLFPSYLFIGCKLDKVSWKSINSTRGVARAVTLDGKYRPINMDIIKGLKVRCDNQGILKTGSSISVGGRARIERGPFSNFICEVENIHDSQRVWVLTELMQQKTRVQVSINEISELI